VQISVVVTTRNDDHGGDQVARINMFMQSLRHTTELASAEVELVIVEWNPPANRPGLAEVLDFQVPTKIIIVPREFHDSFPNNNVGPLFQMIAKNVGIGRAKYPYVCASNPDLFWSAELLLELEPMLGKNKIFRTPRVDIKSTAIPTAATPEGRVQELLGHEIEWHNRPWMDGLLTDACGDFQLLHIDHWRSIGGYCGWPIWSIHIDSLFSVCAYHAGMQQIVLRWPLYHLEHHRSWVVNPEEQNSRPHITLQDIVGWHNIMKAGKFVMSFPYPIGAEWDFGNVDFDTMEIP